MKPTLVVTVLATLSALGFVNCQTPCPGVTGCFECDGASTSRVICTGGGLTEFPQLPLDVQQSVEELILRSNSLTILSSTDLQNFTNLVELDLSLNSLTVIEDGSFNNTTNLEDLVLAGNLLTEIPDNLLQFALINNLDLAENNIGNISAATFNGLQSFSEINLRDNVIRTIPNDTFTGIGRIDLLDLTDNPLRCDCELRWIPEFIEADFRSPSPYDFGSCDFPPELLNEEINSLGAENFTCECSPMCVNGSCNLAAGACECDPGYIGNDCSIQCPEDFYGDNCATNCSCIEEHESRPCSHVDGTCYCRPGYNGSSCEQECPEGSYGQDCLEVCQCRNGGDCDFITGFCNCTIGYMGTFCEQICPPLLYGQDCALSCSCTTGNCHHITGECDCPIGYFGNNCSHNCSDVPDCAGIGRVECSLSTPEQTCGQCLIGYVGDEGSANTDCILCSGGPDCGSLNRDPCSTVVNTCGPCFRRHLGEDGHSNEACFDPCIDGVMNYDETDIDCGGALCPSCQLGEACTGNNDCGSNNSVCLGVFEHPSGLDYPLRSTDNNTCVELDSVGDSMVGVFRDNLLARSNPLDNVDPQFTRSGLEQSVEDEMKLQFQIVEPFQTIDINDLEQAPGDPLYQTCVVLEGSTDGFAKMISNMHSGKLKGTLLLNSKDKKALFNF